MDYLCYEIKEQCTAKDIETVISGIGACLIMVTLSGLSNVYLEKILKRDEVKLTIW